MCRQTRFGRARHRFRKLLNGLGLRHGHRSGDADRDLKAVDGSDPPSRHASIGIGEDGDVHPHLPLRCGVTPIQESRAGRPRRAVTGLVPVLLGDAEQPDGQAVGQRFLRRLEAVLNTLPGGIAGTGATPGGRGRVVRMHTRPRTRTRPSDWGVAPVTACAARAAGAGMPAPAQDIAAPAVARRSRCALPRRRSAHRTPTSFARSGTALSGGADYRPTQLRRTNLLSGAAAGFRPHSGVRPDRLPRRNSASWLERRRASRRVSKIGRATGRTIRNRHYGVGGDQVSTGRSSRFRARPPQPGFGGPGPPGCRCGRPRRPGSRLRGPSAGCRRCPLRGRPPGWLPAC